MRLGGQSAKATYHRFIGKTGGEIFHEMMLRHGVKHVCRFTEMAILTPWISAADESQLDTLVVQSCPYLMPSITQNISISSSRDTNKVPATWPRATLARLVNLELFS